MRCGDATAMRRRCDRADGDATTDLITEVFTVDNGNVSCTGQIVANGNLYVGNGNSHPDFTNGKCKW